jgi:uncharacterized protein with PQ loop repeat
LNIADVIGWTGSVAFALCGLPQAWECYRSNTARGISPLFVGLWLLGEVCYIISVLMKFGWVHWMMFNYGANIVSISVIIFYLVRDRRGAANSKQ